MRLLVIEDDRPFAKLLRLALNEEAHSVDVAVTGREALLLAAVNPYDVILLALSLPDLSSVDVVQQLRRDRIVVPVMMLVGRNEATQVIQVLDAGADEYVMKPVDTGELKARLRALRRRAAVERGPILQFANLTLDDSRRHVAVGGKPVQLPPKEFSLLRYFLERPTEIVKRTELLEKVWDMHFDPGSNIVDVYISRLRLKLRCANAQVSVENVRGIGFRLTGQSSPASMPGLGASRLRYS